MGWMNQPGVGPGSGPSGVDGFKEAAAGRAGSNTEPPSRRPELQSCVCNITDLTYIWFKCL